jgi:hypothetical protein
MRIRLHTSITALLVITCFLHGATGAAAADASPDTTAKFLAGLAVPASRAEEQNIDSPWITHSGELDRAWKHLAEQQLPAVAAWAPEFLGASYQDRGPMFYMFSGPDFLYAHTFFPNASTYILCGAEPIGAIPDLGAIPPEQLPAALANLRKSMESALNWSFFITKNMKVDLNQPHLSGTLPILYVFLARAGCTIESVTAIALDHAGNISDEGKGETAGVRIAFLNANGARQILYYFCSDLSDDGIKSKPGFMNFCERQGDGVSLLKAASYLMHENGFARVRDFLLRQSKMIVQDDSAIPIRYFDKAKWDLRFCGQYLGPIDTFKQHWQPDLADAYAHLTPAPLPFGFGYQWQPNRAALIIAMRKQQDNDRAGSADH